MNIIANIKTDFKEKFGIPRQSGRAPDAKGRIIFCPEYRSPEALRGIEGFSHIWILFDFSLSHTQSFSPTVRPPRLGGNERVGVFASRSPFRPNSIGLSCVKLLGVEHTVSEGDVLLVSGVDILDGTPILDVKPYIPSSDCIPDAKGGYSDAFTNYCLQVVFPQELLILIPEESRSALLQCLADDPRPSYHDDGKQYGMRYSDYNIRFTVENGVLTVSGVERL